MSFSKTISVFAALASIFTSKVLKEFNESRYI